MKPLSSLFAFIALSVFLSLSGCGGSDFPVAPAKGKVVAGGKPVTAGSITFTPIGAPGALETGKSASGAVNPDGTFVLSTFDRFDGAIVGKHRVQYTGPEDESSEEEEEGGESEGDAEPAPKSTPKRQQPSVVQKGEITVEVTKSGPNDFTIDLHATDQ